jgi:hypothetical protein
MENRDWPEIAVFVKETSQVDTDDSFIGRSSEAG